jgi:hypothetical protein
MSTIVKRVLLFQPLNKNTSFTSIDVTNLDWKHVNLICITC